MTRIIGFLGVVVCALALAGCGTSLVQSTSTSAYAPSFAKAAVAADHVIASRAGNQILLKGGNAVDAAVATSFTLSVVRPYSCGIGGGGFMLICMHDEYGERNIRAINYRETAPTAVGADYFAEGDGRDSRRGGAAVGVPGTVAGLLHALENYGVLDRRVVLAPAIRAAEEGFIVDSNHARNARSVVAWFDEEPDRRERFPLMWNEVLKQGSVRAGQRIKSPGQARVLRLIAEYGTEGFYHGEVARAIVDAVRHSGGDMSLDDLTDYRPVDTEPLMGMFMGRTLVTMPPPSSGGIATLQATHILDRLAVDQFEQNSPQYIHLVTEAFKHAFADRARWLADAQFADVPVDYLLDEDYLDGRARMVLPDRTLPPDAYGTMIAGLDDSGTSHLSVVDSRGNAVACTETINLIYGSCVAVDGFGFVLNDEMDDFTTRPNETNAFGLQQSPLNFPAPRKRPLSSMSPLIVIDGDAMTGDVELVAGASGGPRIISGTLQVALNVMLFDDGAVEAVNAPRFHHQWLPETLYLEPAMCDEQLNADLRALGHELAERDGIGTVQLIRRARSGKGWEAASDPRKGGKPAGH